MYSSRYDSEFRDEVRFGKKTLLWIVAFLILLGVVGWIWTRTTKVAEQMVDNALPNYEEFQDIYNTTQKINSDLGTIRDVPDSDPMFAQFSKAAVVAAKRQQMTRWIEEYNAKSKMWNRAMWKSHSLPYQLSTNDFSRYNK
jgi:hypothetical protein